MGEAAREALAGSLLELEGFFQRLESLAHEGWGIVRVVRQNIQRLDSPSEIGGPTAEQTRRQPPTPSSTSSKPSSSSTSSSSGSETGALSGDSDGVIGRRRRGARDRCPRLPSYSSASASPPGSPVRLSPSPSRVDFGPTSIHNNTTMLPSSRSESPISLSLSCQRRTRRLSAAVARTSDLNTKFGTGGPPQSREPANPSIPPSPNLSCHSAPDTVVAGQNGPNADQTVRPMWRSSHIIQYIKAYSI